MNMDLNPDQMDLLAEMVANRVIEQLRPDYAWIPQSEVARQIGRRRMYRAIESGELIRVKHGERNSRCFIQRESYTLYLNNRNHGTRCKRMLNLPERTGAL